MHVPGRGEVAWHGGYQPWMDFYLPRAWRIVMVAEPVARVVSMYYYEHEYTVDVLNGSTLARKNPHVSFADPASEVDTLRRDAYLGPTFVTGCVDSMASSRSCRQELVSHAVVLAAGGHAQFYAVRGD